MTYTVEVDAELCMCSRECVRIAPEAFVIDEDEMVSQPSETAGRADPDVLRQAAMSCPVGAISVEQAQPHDG